MKRTLKIRRSTLRNLNADALREVAGGAKEPKERSDRCTILSKLCPDTDDTWGTALCPELPRTIGG